MRVPVVVHDDRLCLTGAGSGLRALMLTAADVDDRVDGLELGAAGYFGKPLVFTEPVAGVDRCRGFGPLGGHFHDIDGRERAPITTSMPDRPGWAMSRRVAGHPPVLHRRDLTRGARPAPRHVTDPPRGLHVELDVALGGPRRRRNRNWAQIKLNLR